MTRMIAPSIKNDGKEHNFTVSQDIMNLDNSDSINIWKKEGIENFDKAFSHFKKLELNPESNDISSFDDSENKKMIVSLKDKLTKSWRESIWIKKTDENGFSEVEFTRKGTANMFSNNELLVERARFDNNDKK